MRGAAGCMGMNVAACLSAIACLVITSGCRSIRNPWSGRLLPSTPQPTLVAHSGAEPRNAELSAATPSVAAPSPNEVISSDEPPALTQTASTRTWQPAPAESAPEPTSLPVVTAVVSEPDPNAKADEKSGTVWATEQAEASPLAPLRLAGANWDGSPKDLTKDLAAEVQLASAAMPAGTADTGLVVQIENIRVQKGIVKVAVFVEADKFLTKEGAWQAFELPDTVDRQSITLQVNQPCAVAVFQDVDGNGQLTTNRLGIPVEPCGFSNNAVIQRGPPKFAQAAIAPTQSLTTIRLP